MKHNESNERDDTDLDIDSVILFNNIFTEGSGENMPLTPSSAAMRLFDLS